MVVYADFVAVCHGCFCMISVSYTVNIKLVCAEDYSLAAKILVVKKTKW